MPAVFAPEIVAAVLRHMNSDHTDDNVLIARAFGPAEAAEVASAEMAGFDGEGGDWAVTRTDDLVESLRVPWPGGPITERPEVRREIVALYDAACDRLGVTPRPHA